MKPLPQNLVAFIGYFLKPYKGMAVLFCFLAVASGFYGALNSLLLKYIVDALTVTETDRLVSSVLWPSLFFVANFEVHNLCWRGMGYLNYKFQPVIKNKVITETFGYLHQHSHQFFQDHLAGRLANQVTMLADNTERIIHDISRHIIRGIVVPLVAFVNMYYVHPHFFIALLLWLILFTAVSLYLSRRIVTLAEDHASAESLVAGQIVDSLTNTMNVRVFAGRSHEITYLQQALSLAKNKFRMKDLFLLNLHFFQGISLSILLGVMVYFLIQLRLENAVTIGDFALILGLSVEVGFMTWWSLEQVDELNKALGKGNQSLKAIFKSLEIKDKEGALPLCVTSGEISFSKVKFHYKGTTPLFQDKSIRIEAGQKVGLVGYSGSGKSTFVNLILRFYDVNEGHIFIDGTDIRDVTLDSLHESIAMIPQDPSLFHRTLMENIRYGRLEATEAEVIEAAQRAHAHDFIMKLPEGYHSLVGERGIKLSGGQRQRISIARAILKNAPILILDEATSQLDSLTEIDIQKSLWDVIQDSGKTTLVVAHRLSTLLYMDRILVFDKGKIVEDGPHDTLLKQGGPYKTLWDAQIGGFLPEEKMTENALAFHQV